MPLHNIESASLYETMQIPLPFSQPPPGCPAVNLINEGAKWVKPKCLEAAGPVA